MGYRHVDQFLTQRCYVWNLQVEKAQDAITEEEATRMMKRMFSAKFDFNDFLKQYKSVNKMGSLGNVMKMIPGMNKMDDKDLQNVERKYAMYETIIEVCMHPCILATVEYKTTVSFVCVPLSVGMSEPGLQTVLWRL